MLIIIYNSKINNYIILSILSHCTVIIIIIIILIINANDNNNYNIYSALKDFSYLLIISAGIYYHYYPLHILTAVAGGFPSKSSKK